MRASAPLLVGCLQGAARRPSDRAALRRATPGGRIGGYLYFEKLPADAERVQFQNTVVDTNSGRIFAIASLPFVTDG